MSSPKHIVSRDQIVEGSYYALPYEIGLMHEQIAEIKTKQHDLAGHISDAMSQSSETWHDNAPADALFGDLKMLDQLELTLKTAKRKLEVVEYPDQTFRAVTIGSRALVSIVGEAFQLDVTGNLPLKMVAEEGVEVSSIAAPIPLAILGREPGQTATADIEGRLVDVTILEIDQIAQRTFYERS